MRGAGVRSFGPGGSSGTARARESRGRIEAAGLAAAALPVPALTADQELEGALRVRGGETVLVG